MPDVRLGHRGFGFADVVGWLWRSRQGGKEMSSVLATRPDGFKDAHDELVGFESLKDGWDGPGTYAPSAEVCERAMRLFKVSRSYARRAPGVFATDDGAIDLRWPITLTLPPQTPATIELRVLDKGTVFRVRVHGQRRYLVPDVNVDDGQAEKLVVHYLQSSTA
jgi:hypothetical protein